MSIEHRFKLPLPNGLHARPASHLAEAAGAFACTVTLINERTERTANAKSVLALVGAGCRAGDPCRMLFEGIDEAPAREYLARYVSDLLPQCDEPLAAESGQPGQPEIPRSLTAAGLADFSRGKSICPGLGSGDLVALKPTKPPIAPRASTSDTANELARFRSAVAELRGEYAHFMANASGAAAEVLQAHSFLLNDPVLIQAVTTGITGGQSALEAVAASIAVHAEKIREADSVYLRERVTDLEDIETRLLEKLCGPGARTATEPLERPSIVIADQLTPTQLLSLDRSKLRGLVLGQIGPTSHTAILARSFGIPTLIGIQGVAGTIRRGETAIVDGYLGLVVRNPSEGVRRFYDRESSLLEKLEKRRAPLSGAPVTSADGRHLEISANIVSHHEAAGAFAAGADGIGLFRTELLFANRTSAPDEEEQYSVYAAVVRAAQGRPVIIRTLDIGGDKPMPFVPLPAEANPFLGYRGMRLYREYQPLMETQLRALLRAAKLGPLWILVPMVSNIEEGRFVRTWFDGLREKLGLAGDAAPRDLKLGFMLEVPSVAFAIDELCTQAEFFSVGTNDLLQYFFAADRGNEKVADRYDAAHPAFLRLLRQIVERVHKQGRWIGLCGRMAEDSATLPALVALGLDEISVPPSGISTLKNQFATLSSSACEERLQRALACATGQEAKAIFAEGCEKPAPLITPELVLRDLDCETKEEVIHAMISAVQLAGRTENPAVLEDMIWKREDAYSTGFGDGFAMPHGKSDAVAVNSIVVAQLRRPVVWKSLDDAPVDVVILLLIRESGDTRMHLKCISKLSRLLMQDSFREAVRTHTEPLQLAAYLTQALSIDTTPSR